MGVKQTLEQLHNRIPAGITMLHYGGNTNSRDSLFKCQSGHTWTTSFSKIVHKGTRCPEGIPVNLLQSTSVTIKRGVINNVSFS